MEMTPEEIGNEFAVSVIIPMFNAEMVMEKCLDSLAGQRLGHVEFLFVDDGSTDSTATKLTEWMKRRTETDSAYRLIHHKSNRGVAAARNTGLNHAKGKYIYYVDIDDHIEPDTLPILYKTAEENKLDIAGCEWFLAFRQNERRMTQPDADTGVDLFRKMTQGTMRWNLWLFLVRRSLYEDHHIRFIPRMDMGEDMAVMLKLSLHARKVHICHRPFYHYIRTNINSLTKNYPQSIPQITANIEEAERYLAAAGRSELHEYIRLLQLNVKLPFLISSKTSDYKIWLNWFPEANEYIEKNTGCPWYTRMLQKAARAKQFWILRTYYYLVIKVLYGFIYK